MGRVHAGEFDGDAGSTDAGGNDAGVSDAAVVDAGAIDAGASDAGVVDAGTVDFSECELVDGGDPACVTPVYREYCRVRVLRKLYATGCVSDADCSDTPYATNCIAWGLCPGEAVVLTSRMSEFEAARDAELSNFCAHAPCFLGGSCAQYDMRVVCVAGRCEREIVF